MANLDLVLLVLAFVCFLLSAYPPTNARVNLIAAGLAFWVGSLIF